MASGPGRQQDRAVGVQRVDVHALGCLGRCRSPGLAPLRHAEELPVGRPVAGRPVALQVNEGLHQHRPVAVPLLPVLRQLLQRQPQRLRRQELDLHPRKQKEPAVADDQVEVLAVRLALPADPAVAALQVAGGEAEQQAAELAPVSVAQEVAQMRADGLAVALGMVALDPFVPLRDSLPLGHHLQG